MVRIVKKKKKKRIFEKFVTRLFVVSIISAFICLTLVRSYNVSLANVESRQEKQIELLKQDVANLELHVKELDNRERILKVAEKHGLKINQDKIVSVK